MERATGEVVSVFGNLVEVSFSGTIRLGESACITLDHEVLRAEVLEIKGSIAKLQVFDQTYGLFSGAFVQFQKDLIEVELGPGLLGTVFDGLQNPLNSIHAAHGAFLGRGARFSPLSREQVWEFHPSVQKGDSVYPGQKLGFVQEGHINHVIFFPFSLPAGRYFIESMVEQGSYRIEATIAEARSPSGQLHAVSMLNKWPIKKPLLFGQRLVPSKLLETGCRIIDTQFPLLKGGSFCLPGPFGAGKTVLQHHLARYSSADIVIFAACGERAGEVVEVLKEFPVLCDPYTGRPLSERTVLICNTSSMPVAARECSVYIAVTIGEYFRQMGLDVLMVADSTSRWAQAMREMSARLEEIPGDEAFPAYLNSKIAEIYQRAGVVETRDAKVGSLCIGGAVSPAGGSFDEPVTQATLPVVGAFLGLSRDRSSARRYPAIDPLISWSKYKDIVAKSREDDFPNWSLWVQRGQQLLIEGAAIQKRMDVIGEEGIAIEDFITYLKSELYDVTYLQQNSFDVEDVYCSAKKQKHLFSFLNEVLDMDFSYLNTHVEARAFFLKLQSEVRGLNFLEDGTEKASRQYAKILQLLCGRGAMTDAHN